ncbi:MAG: hypothetical protein ACJA2F_001608 [Nitriliruptoraceae bacterium]|jgi:hypothetical protein
MTSPEGFTYKRRKASEAVAIFHHGRLSKTLKGDDATEFLAKLGGDDEQLVMATATGNYRQGTEPRTSLRIARDQEHRGPQGR